MTSTPASRSSAIRCGRVEVLVVPHLIDDGLQVLGRRVVRVRVALEDLLGLLQHGFEGHVAELPPQQVLGLHRADALVGQVEVADVHRLVRVDAEQRLVVDGHDQIDFLLAVDLQVDAGRPRRASLRPSTLAVTLSIRSVGVTRTMRPRTWLTLFSSEVVQIDGAGVLDAGRDRFVDADHALVVERVRLGEADAAAVAQGEQHAGAGVAAEDGAARGGRRRRTRPCRAAARRA